MIERRWAIALLLGLAAGCDDPRRPLDGGRPLQFEDRPEVEKTNSADPCRRREKGGWHYSVGHCEPMTGATTIEGVWINAFEEAGFIDGLKARPDPRDPRRFANEIELDSDSILRSIGPGSASAGGQAVYLRFVGRRTRDPLGVDCFGVPTFVYVVDRVIEAHPLGGIGKIPESWWHELARRPSTVKRVHPGRWGELEATAVKRCRGGRGPPPPAPAPR